MLWGEAAVPSCVGRMENPGSQPGVTAMPCPSLSLVFGKLRLTQVWVEMSRG